mgnify:CR=1 FL=1
MNIVVDTSVVLAVIANEPHKQQIIAITTGATLISSPSLPWEIGNAFSSMFKRGRVTLEQARDAIDTYRLIPIRLTEIDLKHALEVSKQLNIYAYEAFMICCAQMHQCPFVSLDNGLLSAANEAGVRTLEVER